jgi:hypothetical protein
MFKNNHLFFLPLLLVWGCGSHQGDTASRTFQFEMNFSYPGDPVFVYDHLTGDVSDWWDHSFSEKPYRLFIDARPGGGFYEIFDESGDGAKHASVIYAERGKMLRMEGPLGLSGHAVTLVCTYTLQSNEKNSTVLTLNVNGAGEYPDETPDLVRQVWEHFLWEQFKPYIDEHYQSTLNE